MRLLPGAEINPMPMRIEGSTRSADSQWPVALIVERPTRCGAPSVFLRDERAEERKGMRRSSQLDQPEPPPAETAWMRFDTCPACASPAYRTVGAIPDRYYAFGSERIRFPQAAIDVRQCRACGLFYKSLVPGNALLADVFCRHAQQKWTVPHDYGPELRRLRALVSDAAFDVLDVGAADGRLLSACAACDSRGRRSALDVMPYPGVEMHVSGEFIHARLDETDLQWSEEPYDVVTAFDVLEHLHYPDVAFENLRAFVKPGGWLYVETGCAESFWPRHFGIHEWWYARLVEHHVFWSRSSLERIAATHGFTLERYEETRHKGWRDAGFSKIGANLLKTGVYCASGAYYTTLARRFGREGNQPCYPFARDHMRACFRRRDAAPAVRAACPVTSIHPSVRGRSRYPRISIVTCSYQQARYLDQAMRSVIEQDYPALEYIVIDGGSTDGSVPIIERHAESLAYWASERDHGQTDALRKGFARAHGEILGWLCSDDLLLPGALLAVAAFFRARPDVSAVYGDALWIDQDGVFLRPKREMGFNRFVFLYDHNYVPQPSMFWRRELYAAVGGLDPAFDLAMDGDLWERFSRNGEIAHLPRYLSCMRFYPEQKTRSRGGDAALEDARIRERSGIAVTGALARRGLRMAARCMRVAGKVAAGGYGARVPYEHLSWLQRCASELREK